MFYVCCACEMFAGGVYDMFALEANPQDDDAPRTFRGKGDVEEDGHLAIALYVSSSEPLEANPHDDDAAPLTFRGKGDVEEEMGGYDHSLIQHTSSSSSSSTAVANDMRPHWMTKTLVHDTIDPDEAHYVDLLAIACSESCEMAEMAAATECDHSRLQHTSSSSSSSSTMVVPLAADVLTATEDTVVANCMRPHWRTVEEMKDAEPAENGGCTRKCMDFMFIVCAQSVRTCTLC